MKVYLSESHRKDKKFQIVVNGKTIHFGQKGYEDFTIHGDPKRLINYINRHKKNEDWSNPDSPGFFSRWLLWNKPTLQESIADVKRRFGLQVIYK
jgi:hypothetical protein